MEEFNKNQLIFALIILLFIFVISTLSLGVKVHKNGLALSREMNLRFDLEAKESEFSKILSGAEEKNKIFEKSLEEQRLLYQQASNELAQIRDELEKMTKLKETLEEDLKDALIRTKK